jgi:acyl carrier protein
MDIVLNSLRGQFIDASLDLLGPGGCFVEIGKTDIRPTADIAAAHPGVAYHAYDLSVAPPEQIQRAWTVLTEWFTTGVLTPLPTTSYGLTQAIDAFRDMSQARHTGKIVLTTPPVLDPDTTVLITGGTGMLGGVFAEHLITGHGVQHLLLVSRHGPTAPQATQLADRLTRLGAQVDITAADTADPTELAAVLTTIPTTHRLGAVVHTAGILHDAVISELTSTQLHTVLTTKADTALTTGQPCLIPAPLNAATLARHARRTTLPPILSALTTTRPRAATAGPHTLTTRLAHQTPDQRLATLTALITHTTAAVLAHPDPAALDPDQPFKDLGIDSLSALELRNTLATQTGLTLPVALVFDHPTPTALATHLAGLLTDQAATRGPIGQLLHIASNSGQRSTLIDIIIAASSLGPSGAPQLEFRGNPEEKIQRRADSENPSVRLVCIAEFDGQYVRLAHGIQGNIEVAEVLAPGFSGTTLPTSAEEAGQAIFDALRLDEASDHTVIIVGHGITCIPAMHVFKLIETSPAAPHFQKHEAAMIAIAPITTADPTSISNDPLVIQSISTHLYNEGDLISYGRYLSFALRSPGDQPSEERSLIVTPLSVDDHTETVASPLVLEPATLALRVLCWITDPVSRQGLGLST